MITLVFLIVGQCYYWESTANCFTQDPNKFYLKSMVTNEYTETGKICFLHGCLEWNKDKYWITTHKQTNKDSITVKIDPNVKGCQMNMCYVIGDQSVCDCIVENFTLLNSYNNKYRIIK